MPRIDSVSLDPRVPFVFLFLSAFQCGIRLEAIVFKCDQSVVLLILPIELPAYLSLLT